MFQRAYTRASAADLRGPWLKSAFRPAALGNTDAKGNTRSITSIAARDIE